MSAEQYTNMLSESGISEQSAREYELSYLSPEEADAACGYKEAGLFFPYYNLKGCRTGGRLKPEKKEGEEKKKNRARYLQARGSSLHLYFSRERIPQILNPDETLYITEGEKKAIRLGQDLGAPVISFPGCWNWKTSGKDGLAGEWEKVPLKDRNVIFIPDSDFFLNPKVREGGKAFCQALFNRGARVSITDIRDEDGERQGVDDFLLKHGTEELKNRMDSPWWVLEKSDFSNMPRDLSNSDVEEAIT
ncbi:MAG: DUF3854 domain-containing protein [Deltaproteobacteria bacterium]|nr:DUF3854 domain-containing protein [Deltaproteobacteria bacterium]